MVRLRGTVWASVPIWSVMRAFLETRRQSINQSGQLEQRRGGTLLEHDELMIEDRVDLERGGPLRDGDRGLTA